jgi:hypothetical protein
VRRAYDDSFAELLIDYEEDRVLRAVLVGMLREGRRELDRLQAEDERRSDAAVKVSEAIDRLVKESTGFPK